MAPVKFFDIPRSNSNEGPCILNWSGSDTKSAWINFEPPGDGFQLDFDIAVGRLEDLGRPWTTASSPSSPSKADSALAGRVTAKSTTADSRLTKANTHVATTVRIPMADHETEHPQASFEAWKELLGGSTPKRYVQEIAESLPMGVSPTLYLRIFGNGDENAGDAPLQFVYKVSLRYNYRGGNGGLERRVFVTKAHKHKDHALRDARDFARDFQLRKSEGVRSVGFALRGPG